MPEEKQREGSRRLPYVPPEVTSELIQDLSAGGCGKCPNSGVDSSQCPPEDPLGTS